MVPIASSMMRFKVVDRVDKLLAPPIASTCGPTPSKPPLLHRQDEALRALCPSTTPPTKTGGLADREYHVRKERDNRTHWWAIACV